MEKLIITSSAFSEGDWIPNRYSGFGEDISPELHISGICGNAVSLVITFDDMGHPIQPGYNHWVACNIPPISLIPENLPKGNIIDEPFHIEQGLAYGKHTYRGPKPPFNWNHTYKFTVYVLDVLLNVNTNSNKKNVLNAAEGHILQSATLSAKYQKKHK